MTRKSPPDSWSRDDRASLVDRFLELRPTLAVRMLAAVPEDLRIDDAATPHQLQALVRIGAEGMTMRELAECLAISGPAACALADRLVARELAIRTMDPSDRRVVRLAATDKGHEMAARYSEGQRRAIGTLLERLSDEQLRAWIEIMECLAADAEDEAQGLAGAVVR